MTAKQLVDMIEEMDNQLDIESTLSNPTNPLYQWILDWRNELAQIYMDNYYDGAPFESDGPPGMSVIEQREG